MIVWIDGTYCSGKSSIAESIEEKRFFDKTVYLDSDKDYRAMIQTNPYLAFGGTTPQNNQHFIERFRAAITPSMSRRGNCYDNAMAENYFSILKTECIYRHKPKTFREANECIDGFIHFYNHERIQLKTGVAPLARRHSA